MFLQVRECWNVACRRLYSTGVSQAALSKWGIASIPRPKSLLDDHDESPDLSEELPDTSAKPKRHTKLARKPTPPAALRHKDAMKRDFGEEGWNPPRKLSREAMDGLRALHQYDKVRFSTPVLAEKFRISPEAVRRILKSQWRPTDEQVMKNVRKHREGYQAWLNERRMKERRDLESLMHIKRSVTDVDGDETDGFDFR
jgi:hypothetical protein